MPSSHYLAHCDDEVLALRHMGFTLLGAKALAVGLGVRYAGTLSALDPPFACAENDVLHIITISPDIAANTASPHVLQVSRVTHLDLSDNVMNGEQLEAMVEDLRQLKTLTHLVGRSMVTPMPQKNGGVFTSPPSALG